MRLVARNNIGGCEEPVGDSHIDAGGLHQGPVASSLAIPCPKGRRMKVSVSKSNLFRPESLPGSGNISPPGLLAFRFRYIRLDTLANSDGISSVNWVRFCATFSNLDRLPSLGEISPINWLSQGVPSNCSRHSDESRNPGAFRRQTTLGPGADTGVLLSRG